MNAPPEFKRGLKELPDGVKIVDSGKEYNQVHWFVLSKAQVDKEVDKIMKLVKDNVICWAYFPKGSSKWIVTAKREETRMERVKGTIERLEKNWKNPGNM